MANMSYCRFENTVGDLRDCYSVLCDGKKTNELSEREAKFRDKLIDLAVNITALAGDCGWLTNEQRIDLCPEADFNFD